MIPDHVKIGGITYAVRIQDDWPGRADADGEFCYSAETGNVIFIRAGLTPEATLLTLLHESLHAMNSTMDHEFLDSLSQQLYQFLTDNGLWKNGAR